MAVDLTSSRQRVNGIELHVMEAGPDDGPLVLMLHGFPDAWWTWTRQMRPLVEQGFRVIVPDLRGYNLSAKPPGVPAYTLDKLTEDVIGLADAYGRNRFRLVGHDWGGVVAFAVGIRHPKRLERLIVMAAPHPHVRFRQVLRHPSQVLRSSYVLLFQLPWVPEALLGSRRFAIMRRMLTVSGSPGLFTSTELVRYVDAWAQPGALTAMLNYYRALRFGRPDVPRWRLNTPTLIIWGGRDIALLPHLYRMSLALCARGEGLFLDGAGHWVHLEEPAIVSDAVVRFLTESVTAGVSS